jgi:hypothetical protein
MKRLISIALTIAIVVTGMFYLPLPMISAISNETARENIRKANEELRGDSGTDFDFIEYHLTRTDVSDWLP